MKHLEEADWEADWEVGAKEETEVHQLSKTD